MDKNSITAALQTTIANEQKHYNCTNPHYHSLIAKNSITATLHTKVS